MNKYRRILLIFVFLLLIINLFGQINEKGKVYYLKIIQDFGAVSSNYSSYLKKKLEEANADPLTEAIVIEIDTPGGAVADAQKIAKYIKNSKNKTITFINDSAYSAGAIISLAADYTVMVEGGKIGDAYPIMIQGGQPSSIKDKKVQGKIMSGLVALIRGLAEKRQKRLIEEISKGNPRYKHLENSNSVRNLTKICSAMVDPDITLSLSEDGFDHKNNQPLTLTTDEAYKLGVADSVKNDIHELLEEFKLSNLELVKLEVDSFDRILTIMTHPIATTILLILGFVGMVMEFTTSGWGVAGTIGIVALALFFYGQIVVNDASLSALVLFILGLILIAVELFVIPGFGLVGAAGVIALSLSIISALGVDFFNLEGTSYKLRDSLVIFIIAILSTGIIIFILSRFIPKTKRFEKFTLANENITSVTFKADENKDLIGEEGIVLSTLRPSGVVKINDRRVDVVADSSFIEKGKKVKVIQAGGGKVVVTELI